jgi:hypothetical protein
MRGPPAEHSPHIILGPPPHAGSRAQSQGRLHAPARAQDGGARTPTCVGHRAGGTTWEQARLDRRDARRRRADGGEAPNKASQGSVGCCGMGRVPVQHLRRLGRHCTRPVILVVILERVHVTTHWCGQGRALRLACDCEHRDGYKFLVCRVHDVEDEEARRGSAGATTGRARRACGQRRAAARCPWPCGAGACPVRSMWLWQRRREWRGGLMMVLK